MKAAPIVGGPPAGFANVGSGDGDTVGGRPDVPMGGVDVGVGFRTGAVECTGRGRGAVRAGLGATGCGDGLTRGRGAVKLCGEGSGPEDGRPGCKDGLGELPGSCPSLATEVAV